MHIVTFEFYRFQAIELARLFYVNENKLNFIFNEYRMSVSKKLLKLKNMRYVI